MVIRYAFAPKSLPCNRLRIPFALVLPLFVCLSVYYVRTARLLAGQMPRSPQDRPFHVRTHAGRAIPAIAGRRTGERRANIHCLRAACRACPSGILGPAGRSAVRGSGIDVAERQRDAPGKVRWIGIPFTGILSAIVFSIVDPN